MRLRLGWSDVLLNVVARYPKLTMLIALKLDYERLLGKIRGANLPDELSSIHSPIIQGRPLDSKVAVVLVSAGFVRAPFKDLSVLFEQILFFLQFLLDLEND